MAYAEPNNLTHIGDMFYYTFNTLQSNGVYMSEFFLVVLFIVSFALHKRFTNARAFLASSTYVGIVSILFFFAGFNSLWTTTVCCIIWALAIVFANKD